MELMCFDTIFEVNERNLLHERDQCLMLRRNSMVNICIYMYEVH